MDSSNSDNEDWIPVVKNPRSQFHGTVNHRYQGFHTLFVDNLPVDVGIDEIRFLFNKFGVVRDVFIPLKRSKVTGNKFGFVRYDCRVSAEVAISKANDMFFKERKLFVKSASFGKQDVIEDRRLIKSRNHGFEAGTRCPNRTQSYHIRVDSNKTAENGAPFLRNNRGVGSYAEALAGHKEERKLAYKSIQCHSIGNGWLFRSAVAKIRKLISAKDLENVFNSEKIYDIQIKAIGGRFVIVMFANEETRDKILKEKWVKNWFDEFKPWNGEQAKEERFVWISCFGMPLSAWSSQTFKDIGSLWGDFLEVDENTLKRGSYEKGRILIATDHSQTIEGIVELVEDGKQYIVRIEEESSFRKVESSNFFAVIDSGRTHEDQFSQVPKEAQSSEVGAEEDPNVNTFKSSQDLESFVEDSLGIQSLFHEIHGGETVEKTSSHEKILDGNPIDPNSLDEADSRGFDFDDLDLVSNEHLIKYVECMRHKKAHKTKMDKRRKNVWCKNPLKTTIFSRTVTRDSKRSVSTMGSKKGGVEGPTQPTQVEGLLDEGAENIAVNGLPPLGCIPVGITLLPKIPTNSQVASDRTKRKCLDYVNVISEDFNVLLRKALEEMQSKWPKTKIAYIDFEEPLLHVIKNPDDYGFTEVNKGCCGTGLKEIGIQCNETTPVCGDPSKYVFWDAAHPTEKAYAIIFASNVAAIDDVIRE